MSLWQVGLVVTGGIVEVIEEAVVVVVVVVSRVVVVVVGAAMNVVGEAVDVVKRDGDGCGR